MKICFFSNDKLISDLSKRMEGVEISILKSLSNIKTYVESNPSEKILLFMDLDEGEEAYDINREFLDHEQTIRILITEKVPLKKLKKHQAGKESAFGYIKKPLTPELVSGIVNDFELSEYVEKNNLTHEGDQVKQEQVELTFIGIKKPDLDDVPVEEEILDVTAGQEMNEFRVEAPKDDEDDDVDIDLGDGFEIDNDENQIMSDA